MLACSISVFYNLYYRGSDLSTLLPLYHLCDPFVAEIYYFINITHISTYILILLKT